MHGQVAPQDVGRAPFAARRQRPVEPVGSLAAGRPEPTTSAQGGAPAVEGQVHASGDRSAAPRPGRRTPGRGAAALLALRLSRSSAACAASCPLSSSAATAASSCSTDGPHRRHQAPPPSARPAAAGGQGAHAARPGVRTRSAWFGALPALPGSALVRTVLHPSPRDFAARRLRLRGHRRRCRTSCASRYARAGQPCLRSGRRRPQRGDGDGQLGLAVAGAVGVVAAGLRHRVQHLQPRGDAPERRVVR